MGKLTARVQLKFKLFAKKVISCGIKCIFAGKLPKSENMGVLNVLLQLKSYLDKALTSSRNLYSLVCIKKLQTPDGDRSSFEIIYVIVYGFFGYRG